MKHLFRLFAFVLMLAVAGACATKKTVYFDQLIRQNVESYDIQMTDIQFYNSKEIILERDLSYEETKVASGKIRFENGRFIERIIIKKETPGVCEGFDNEVIDVAFEPGENKVLKFVRDAQDKYRVSAIEWKNKYGKVAYDTTHYFIVPGGEKAILKVKLEDIYKFDKKQRVATGRTIQKKTSSEE